MHVANSQHLNISACINIPPFVVCQHCCCFHFYPLCRNTNSWRSLLLQVYLGMGVCTETPVSYERGTYGLGNFNGRRRTTLQLDLISPFPLNLAFERPNPALRVGLLAKHWACVSSWNFTLSLLCRMWVT